MKKLGDLIYPDMNNLDLSSDSNSSNEVYNINNINNRFKLYKGMEYFV